MMYEDLISRLRSDLDGPASDYWQLMRNAAGAIERLSKDLSDYQNTISNQNEMIMNLCNRCFALIGGRICAMCKYSDVCRKTRSLGKPEEDVCLK